MPSIATTAVYCHRLLIHHGGEKYYIPLLPQLAPAINLPPPPWQANAFPWTMPINQKGFNFITLLCYINSTLCRIFFTRCQAAPKKNVMSGGRRPAAMLVVEVSDYCTSTNRSGDQPLQWQSTALNEDTEIDGWC